MFSCFYFHHITSHKYRKFGVILFKLLLTFFTAIFFMNSYKYQIKILAWKSTTLIKTKGFLWCPKTRPFLYKVIFTLLMWSKKTHNTISSINIIFIRKPCNFVLTFSNQKIKFLQKISIMGHPENLFAKQDINRKACDHYEGVESLCQQFDRRKDKN